MDQTPAQVIEHLFALHLDCTTTVEKIDTRIPFYELYQHNLTSFKSKEKLLKLAEDTFCADVIMDVLLFLSQTLNDRLFQELLIRNSSTFDLWVHYLRQTQDISNHQDVITLPVIRLLMDTHRIDMLSREMTHIVVRTVDPKKAVEIGDTAIRMLKKYPAFQSRVAELEQYIEVLKLQVQMEQNDEQKTVKKRVIHGVVDKKSDTKHGVQLNWRKRYMYLEDGVLTCYRSSEREAKSLDSISPDSIKGKLCFSRDTKMRSFCHNGKTFDRPFCIEIKVPGQSEMVLDTGSKDIHDKWFDALQVNIQQKKIDNIWIRYPRSSTIGLSLSRFLYYCAFYHDGVLSTKQHNQPLSLHHSQTISHFRLDEKRVLHILLSAYAKRGDWARVREFSKLDESSQRLFLKKKSPIGYGPILDICLSLAAPEQLITLCTQAWEEETKSFLPFNKDTKENKTSRKGWRQMVRSDRTVQSIRR